MSEDRETQSAGSPVEETEASRTDVLAAIQRTRASEDSAGDAETGASAADAAAPGTESAAGETAATTPDRGPSEGGAAGDPAGAARDAAGEAQSDGSQRFASASLDTQPHLERPVIRGSEELPSAAPTASAPTAVAAPAAETSPASTAAFGGQLRDGEIRIDSDHPMAALYMQTPMPPELRGNRGAGTLIALLATLVFALVYAGVIAARLAPVYPPSRFLEDGLLPFLFSWGFIAATAAFFIGLVVIVLIVGRAGWWAYVLGGFPLGLFVGAAAILGYALSEAVMSGGADSWDLVQLLRDFGLTTPVLGAAIVAREVAIWFGAWIGARGRRMKAKNAELLADYESAMAEARAKKS